MQAYNQFNFDFFIFHVPNQQNTSKAYTMELVRMGLRAGVADYCILFPGAQTAFLELKRNKTCRMSRKQESFQKQCFLLGNPYMCTHDIDLAISWITNLGEALLMSDTSAWG
jgi:3-hydroxy-3-methylglutaryl CoA synthase